MEPVPARVGDTWGMWAFEEGLWRSQGQVVYTVNSVCAGEGTGVEKAAVKGLGW